MPEYVDIHTHLNFSAFDEDREFVAKRTLAANVWAINIGTQRDTSAAAVAMAQRYEGMYAAVGLHPIHTAKSFHDEDELGQGGSEFVSRGEIFDPNAYRELASDPKVVAIGECGLDYFRLEEDTKERQRESFLAQIALANELQKPLMLHLRSAYQDAYELLKGSARVQSHLHFFAGSVTEAKMFLDLGCTFSFTGVITFARSYDEVIQFLPMDRIMVETDAPYLAPEPHRGKRNEPRFVTYVAEKLALIKGMNVEAVRKQLLANTKRVFGIPIQA